MGFGGFPENLEGSWAVLRGFVFSREEIRGDFRLLGDFLGGLIISPFPFQVWFPLLSSLWPKKRGAEGGHPQNPPKTPNKPQKTPNEAELCPVRVPLPKRRSGGSQSLYWRVPPSGGVPEPLLGGSLPGGVPEPFLGFPLGGFPSGLPAAPRSHGVGEDDHGPGPQTCGNSGGGLTWGRSRTPKPPPKPAGRVWGESERI